jgi:prepilin-type N-terminal cleavage/methylation domain-containing protein/prepilin-type processing-associated H-X9-DG protein
MIEIRLRRSIQMRLNRAFTLVELLVVVGIIAVLIGVLVPALSAARASASDTQCRARLRQLFQAQQIYAIQNNDRMAPVVHAGLPSPYASGTRLWREALSDVMRISEDRSANIFECPSRPDDATNTYGLNSAIAMPQWGLRMSKRTDPTRTQIDYVAGNTAEKPFSQLILFADKGASPDDMLRSSDGFAYITESTTWGIWNAWEQWARHSAHGTLRHRGKSANAAFMDGHVDVVRDELRLQSGHWFFGQEPEGIKIVGAGCCQ